MIKSLNIIFIKISIILTSGMVFYSCNKEVSVSPPDSLPPNGYLYVDSNPKGFEIYLNNKARARITPDSLTWLTTGTYLVTLKKALYKDTSVTVNVVVGEKHSVFVDLTQNQSTYGSIYCTSYPAKAEIFINDSSTGQVTPHLFNILPGNYYINYRLKNHRDVGEQTSVSSGNMVYSKVILVDTSLWKEYTSANSQIPSGDLTCLTIDPGDILYAGTYDASFFSYEERIDEWKPYPNTLSRTINCIQFDKNGALYVGTKKGMVYLYISTWITYGSANTNWPDYNVHAIAFDNEGTCYIGTDKGITFITGPYKFSPTVTDGGKKITPVISALTIDSKGNIWAGLNGYGIAENTNSSSWVISSSSNINLISNYITTLKSSPSGEVWAGFAKQGVYGGLSYFNGSSWNNIYPIQPTSRTNSIYIDKNNIKWVATDAGLVKFSSPSDVTTFNYDNTGLAINNVTGVVGDSKGNIWIATSTGLYKYKGN